MRLLALAATAAIILSAAMTANAAPLTGAALSNGAASPIVQVQAQPKKETVTEKVKRSATRAWKRVAGYKFRVNCLTSKSVCTETGKSRDDARAKCQSAHPLCLLNDTK